MVAKMIEFTNIGKGSQYEIGLSKVELCLDILSKQTVNSKELSNIDWTYLRKLSLYDEGDQTDSKDDDGTLSAELDSGMVS